MQIGQLKEAFQQTKGSGWHPKRIQAELLPTRFWSPIWLNFNSNSHLSTSIVGSIAKIWLWSSNFTSHHILIQRTRPDAKQHSVSLILVITSLSTSLIPVLVHSLDWITIKGQRLGQSSSGHQLCSLANNRFDTSGKPSLFTQLID